MVKVSRTAAKLSKIDPLTRAQFREVAREIVSKDRQSQALSLSQNTIGEIERALVRAFDLGQLRVISVKADEEQKTFLEWILIPPRSRETLSEFIYVDWQTGIQFGRHCIERISDKDQIKWRFVNSSTLLPNQGGRLISGVSVLPLIEMKLIYKPHQASEVYDLTLLGFNTLKEYHRRVIARDPTLPKISLRAIGPRRP